MLLQCACICMHVCVLDFNNNVAYFFFIEETEEAQFVHIDRCYQYRGFKGASFSKEAISAKSACRNKFGGQSYYTER